MAKYSKKAGKKVEKTMHEMKKGKLKSGRSGRKVTDRKQAIAIGLSEARKGGAKVPKKGSKKGAKKSAAKKGAKKSARNSAPRKTASKGAAKKGAKKGATKKGARRGAKRKSTRK